MKVHEKYRVIFESANDAVFLIDPQTTKIIDCNWKAAEMDGYSVEELKNMTITSLHPDDERAILPEKFKEVSTKGSVAGIGGLHHVRKDGGLVHIEVNATVIEIEGKMLNLSIVRDVTERKKSEEALIEKERLLSESQQIARIGSWVYDVTGRISWSDETYRIYGVSPDTFTPNAESFINLIHPDDRPSMQAWIDACLAGEKPGELEFRSIMPDGAVHFISGRGELKYDAENRPSYMAGTAQDITERKRAEEIIKKSESMLKETQRLAKVGGWEYDVEKKKITWTDEVYRIYGVSPQEYDPNDVKQDIEFYASEEQATIERAFNEAIREGKPYDLQLKFTNAKGENLWVRTIGRAEMKDGKVARVYGNIVDITEIKTAEDALHKFAAQLEDRVEERTGELAQSQKALTNMVDDLNKTMEELKNANLRLQELDRMKSMFIASTSHELRTPLNSIIGFSSVLLEGWSGKLTTEQKEQLQIIHSAGKQLLALINDVIDISKIEAGKLEAYQTEFRLKEVVDEVAALLGKNIEEKGLALSVEVPDITIATDRHRLLQCLLNYLSNAVKFSEKGSISIKAKSINNLIDISVTDTGIGIKEEDILKLFAPFVRLESPLSVQAGGTGLGLYLTKKLVEEVLGGTVAVKSKYDKGSTFSLRIPVKLEAKS